MRAELSGPTGPLDETIFESDAIKKHLFQIEALFSARNIAFDYVQRVAGLNEKSLENSEMGAL